MTNITKESTRLLLQMHLQPFVIHHSACDPAYGSASVALHPAPLCATHNAASMRLFAVT